MSGTPLLLALDQGTSSSRAMVFTPNGELVASAQEEFPQSYPHEGWVEQDPNDIWASILSVAKKAIAKAEADGDKIVSIGITNQRETTILWDRKTGVPVYPAIVWQDRRTADECARLKADGAEVPLRRRTGLLLDPYFSATKVAWILDNVEGARTAAEAGKLAFGTVDSWLVWKLTGGHVHATDATNASRTNLLNLTTGEWDDEMLSLFRVPRALLPEVKDSAADFGNTDPNLFGRPIPIGGIAGDQQAAAIGQGCFDVGSAKSTYGTGCFLLVQAGNVPPTSDNALLSTVSYQLEGKRAYCLEGSIFIAGSGVKWLRDSLGLIQSADETEALAKSIPHTGGVYVVPAFTGLGAPHWAPEARGLIAGKPQRSGTAELGRATHESGAEKKKKILGMSGIRSSDLLIDRLMPQPLGHEGCSN